MNALGTIQSRLGIPVVAFAPPTLCLGEWPFLFSVLIYIISCLFSYQFALVNKDVVDANCDNLLVGKVGWRVYLRPHCRSWKLEKTYCIGYKNHDCTKTFVVQVGDTCYWITMGQEVSKGVLLANNPNIKFNCYFNTIPVCKVIDTVHINSTRAYMLLYSKYAGALCRQR